MVFVGPVEFRFADDGLREPAGDPGRPGALVVPVVDSTKTPHKPSDSRFRPGSLGPPARSRSRKSAKLHLVPSQNVPPGGLPPAWPSPPGSSAAIPAGPAASGPSLAGPAIAPVAGAPTAAQAPTQDELTLRARVDRLEAKRAAKAEASLSPNTKVTLDLKATSALVAGAFIAAWTASAWVNAKLDAVRADLRAELASKADVAQGKAEVAQGKTDVAQVKADVMTLQAKLDKTADDVSSIKVAVGQVQGKLDLLVTLSQPKTGH